MKPDAMLQIRLKKHEEGGRRTGIAGDYYACPLYIDDEAFECRLLLSGQTLALGVAHRVPVKFMNSEVVKKLVVGKKISLWEGKIIADGEVLELL